MSWKVNESSDPLFISFIKESLKASTSPPLFFPDVFSLAKPSSVFVENAILPTIESVIPPEYVAANLLYPSLPNPTLTLPSVSCVGFFVYRAIAPPIVFLP